MPHIAYDAETHLDKIVHLVTGVLLILIGSYMATSVHLDQVPHFLQDAVAYLVHGCGAAPIIAALLGETS